MGINRALEVVKSTGALPVPLHLRNAPTKLMSELGYADGYLYPHDYPHHFVAQRYLPEELADLRLWTAADNPAEQRAATLQANLRDTQAD